MTTETPAAYAAVLARLHACGVGFGSGRGITSVEMGWVRLFVALIRIEDLYPHATFSSKPSLFKGRRYTFAVNGRRVYRGKSLLQAADAVCEWVEREPTP